MTDKQQGAGTGPFDPFTAWQQWAKAGEEFWSRQFEAFVNTDRFATMLGQYLDGYLTSHEGMRRAVEQYLSTMNVPTRADLTRIAELIVGVDAKLDDLVAELEARDPASPPQDDGVADRLAALAAAVERVERRLAESAEAPSTSQGRKRPASKSTSAE